MTGPRTYKSDLSELMERFGYTEEPPDANGRRRRSGHFAFVKQGGRRIVAASTPVDADVELEKLERRLKRYEHERQLRRERQNARREATVAAVRQNTPPGEVDKLVSLFLNWMCELHEVGPDESRAIRIRLGEEVDAWRRSTGTTLPASKDAFLQALRLRMDDDATTRLGRIEIRKGGKSYSTYELRGRNYGLSKDPQESEDSERPNLELVPSGPLATPVEEPKTPQGTQPDEAQPEEAPSPVPSTPKPAAPGDLMGQIADLVSRASRVDDAEAKSAIALELVHQLREQAQAVTIQVNALLDHLETAEQMLR